MSSNTVLDTCILSYCKWTSYYFLSRNVIAASAVVNGICNLNEAYLALTSSLWRRAWRGMLSRSASCLFKAFSNSLALSYSLSICVIELPVLTVVILLSKLAKLLDSRTGKILDIRKNLKYGRSLAKIMFFDPPCLYLLLFFAYVYCRNYL